MKNRLSFLILIPLALGSSQPDSAYTELSLGAGRGQYAHINCSEVSFVDAGVRVVHNFQSPWRIGLSISVIRRQNSTTAFAFPDLAYDSKYFSLGTTGLRVGPKDLLYIEVSFADQVPTFSGKGLAHWGVGGYISSWDTQLWLGQNAGPYDQPGLAGQIDFPIATNYYLFFNGRTGKSHSITEYGVSTGLRIVMP
jgi:hypothetical protein